MLAVSSIYECVTDVLSSLTSAFPKSSVAKLIHGALLNARCESSLTSKFPSFVGLPKARGSTVTPPGPISPVEIR